jgi:hypothetical protein
MFGLDLKLKAFTAEDARVLRSEPITGEGPGAIVHDFDTMLKLIGTEGVEARGELRLLPMRMLADLNAAMREPLRIDMQRAQLRSYPNLQALYMLGRASGLVMPIGGGKDARLAVDPELLRQWVEFNPVERYSMLLEAWTLHADWEVVGERRGWESMLRGALRTWDVIPQKGLRITHKQRSATDPYSGLRIDRFMPGFLWLFGLITVEQGEPVPRKPWCPAKLGRTPFGGALLALLGRNWKRFSPFPDDDDQDQTPDDQSGGTCLNELQPILRPYFPDWVRSLTIPPPEFRDGTYVFKVVLNKIWRRIAVPGKATWDDLGDAIRRSVGFDADHLWAFTWIDRFGAKTRILRQEGLDSGADDSIGGEEICIGGVPLRLNEPLEFIYDFGDNWRFEVIPERIEAPDPKFKKPKVTESGGKPPKQYEGDWE